MILGLKLVEENDWPAEFLDLILAVRIVESMGDAFDHIERHGSNHTEAIITKFIVFGSGQVRM